MRRSLYDGAWRDEAVRRYLRRKYRTQQRERALADLRAELEKALAWLLAALSGKQP